MILILDRKKPIILMGLNKSAIPPQKKAESKNIQLN